MPELARTPDYPEAIPPDDPEEDDSRSLLPEAPPLPPWTPETPSGLAPASSPQVAEALKAYFAKYSEPAEDVGPLPEGWAERRAAQEAALRAAAEARRDSPILPEAPARAAKLLALPRPVRDFNNMHEVAGALVGVPMIDHDTVEAATAAPAKGEFWREDVTLPMSRIVGIGTFETWAGRGFEPSKPGMITTKDGRSSLGTIAEYAKAAQSDAYEDVGGAPKLRLFEDADGETWAYTYQDGSHRTAAAKLREDPFLYHAIVEDAEQRPRVDFSVTAELERQKWQGLAGRLGELSVDAYQTQYASASEAHDNARS